MKKIFIIAATLLLGLVWYFWTHPLVSKVRIGDDVITVRVAATESQKQKGLGGVTSLQEHEGMLFPYDHKEAYEFWMRGMKIPLDFIWIDDTTIVDITQNVPPPKPGEQPAIVKPRVPVDKVLEVSAGTVRQSDIHIGDRVHFLDR